MSITPSPNRSAFISGRLVEARVARGMTITQLAELSGLSKTSISNYESSSQAPREDKLKRLSQALNIPEHYFYKPLTHNHELPVTFRSLAAASKRDRAQAASKLGWLSDILSLVTQLVELPTPNIPDLAFGRKPTDISFDEIEILAEQCRRHFGLKDRPISNVAQLLENNGVIVVHMPFDAPGLDAFSAWLLDSETPVIISTSEGRSSCRDRFNLAHELGHLVLHRAVKELNRDILPLMEKQAFRFASAFLMPAKTYASDFTYPTLDVLSVLKRKWLVSIQAQIMRCKDLCIITDEQGTRLFMNLARRGWKTEEPLDDVIPREKSQLLKQALKLLIEEGELSKEELLTELGLPANDVCDVANLPRDFFDDKQKIISLIPRLKRA